MKTKFLSLLTAAALIGTFGVTTLQAKNGTQKQGKPFLILGKLPHLTGLVKLMWDDEDLALTAEQQKKLLVVRKNTMTQAKALGQKVNALEAQIIISSNEGATPASLKKQVSELADLRAAATMVHLDCIYDTRQILTKEQLYILE